jgi:hypothetical protein
MTRTWWLTWDSGRSWHQVSCHVYNHFRKLCGYAPAKPTHDNAFTGVYADYEELTHIEGKTLRE